ncbi:MAG: SDR family oxidoreductase [Firmicutes bacterium]|nr:SDR family oxidoreductase [Bacillota bacterium]
MFQNKLAIVTGGASGIGKELCLELGKRGAKVIIADINLDKAQEVVNIIANRGSNAIAIRTDVSKKESVKALIDFAIMNYNRIDLLINNAGVGLDGEFRDMTLKHWERITNINYWGVVYGTHYAYKVMIEQGFGQIVNVSSLAGLLPSGLMSSYVATKHSVVGFTLALRAEAYQYGIKVNVLCPGFIETSIQDTTPKVTDYLEKHHKTRDKSKFPTADQCVAKMIKGIEQNKAIIISPAKQKVFWWLNRLFPTLMPIIWKKIIKHIKMGR